MSVLAYALAGGLGGVGKTLTDTATAKQSAIAAEIEERRALARANLKAELDRGTNVQQAELATNLENIKTGNRTQELKTEYALKDVNDARTNKRKTESDIIVDTARTKNDAALEKIKSSLNINETAIASARELSNKLTLAKKEVDKWAVTADGSMVAYSKTGEKIGQTKANIFPKDADEAPIGIGLGAVPAASPSDTQPRPAAAVRSTLKPVSQVKVLSPQDIANAVNQALGQASRGDPRWAGMTGEEIKSKIERDARAAGYKF